VADRVLQPNDVVVRRMKARTADKKRRRQHRYRLIHVTSGSTEPSSPNGAIDASNSRTPAA